MLNDLLNALDAEPLDLSDAIANDTLRTPGGERIGCTIHRGLDVVKVRACDRLWRRFNDDLLGCLFENYPEELQETVFNGLSLEDAHWEWLRKVGNHHSDEYNWFFLYANGEPQAACVIYHPKTSVFSPGDIFYIEYVATAPWNRQNILASRRFCGVVPVLLKHVINYAHVALKLRHGFSLHALSKACSFYEKIGMQRHTAEDKPHLTFYEMTEEATKKFVAGGAHV